MKRLLVASFLAFWPTVALAHEPEPYARDVDDVKCLAFAMHAEANRQVDEAHVAIGQIVMNRAIEGGVTICYLVTETRFLSVFPYALARQDSWQWLSFKYGPPARHLSLARSVLAGRPDQTDGLRYFNGLGYEDPADCAKIIDHTCFKERP